MPVTKHNFLADLHHGGQLRGREERKEGLSEEPPTSLTGPVPGVGSKDQGHRVSDAPCVSLSLCKLAWVPLLF